MGMPTLKSLMGMGETAAQGAASVATTGIAIESAYDAMVAEAKMAFLTHQAREQGLWSVATKQADAQSARMAKQSEAWGQI